MLARPLVSRTVPAKVDLDAHVDKFVNLFQAVLVGLETVRFLGHECENAGVLGGADSPDMHIADPGVGIGLDGGADLLPEPVVSPAVQKDAAGLPQKRPSPNADHDGPHKTHNGVKPSPVHELAAEQSDDGKNRSEGVDDNVKIEVQKNAVSVIKRKASE